MIGRCLSRARGWSEGMKQEIIETCRSQNEYVGLITLSRRDGCEVLISHVRACIDEQRHNSGGSSEEPCARTISWWCPITTAHDRGHASLNVRPCLDRRVPDIKSRGCRSLKSDVDRNVHMNGHTIWMQTRSVNFVEEPSCKYLFSRRQLARVPTSLELRSSCNSGYVQ